MFLALTKQFKYITTSAKILYYPDPNQGWRSGESSDSPASHQCGFPGFEPWLRRHMGVEFTPGQL